MSLSNTGLSCAEDSAPIKRNLDVCHGDNFSCVCAHQRELCVCVVWLKVFCVARTHLESLQHSNRRKSRSVGSPFITSCHTSQVLFSPAIFFGYVTPKANRKAGLIRSRPSEIRRNKTKQNKKNCTCVMFFGYIRGQEPTWCSLAL